jgi:hypothetical protein
MGESQGLCFVLQSGFTKNGVTCPPPTERESATVFLLGWVRWPLYGTEGVWGWVGGGGTEGLPWRPHWKSGLWGRGVALADWFLLPKLVAPAHVCLICLLCSLAPAYTPQPTAVAAGASRDSCPPGSRTNGQGFAGVGRGLSRCFCFFPRMLLLLLSVRPAGLRAVRSHHGV